MFELIVNGRTFTTFTKAIKNKLLMKSSEFHRLILKNGWVLVRVAGSHYLYEKEGKREPVPYHGSKEMGEGLRKKLIKKMGLK